MRKSAVLVIGSGASHDVATRFLPRRNRASDHPANKWQLPLANQLLDFKSKPRGREGDLRARPGRPGRATHHTDGFGRGGVDATPPILTVTIRRVSHPVWGVRPPSGRLPSWGQVMVSVVNSSVAGRLWWCGAVGRG